jgi:hypothetical protein
MGLASGTVCGREAWRCAAQIGWVESSEEAE